MTVPEVLGEPFWRVELHAASWAARPTHGPLTRQGEHLMGTMLVAGTVSLCVETGFTMPALKDAHLCYLLSSLCGLRGVAHVIPAED